MPQDTLHPHHLLDLQNSGLSDETIRASGCYSGQEPTTRMLLGFGVGPGLVFPFPGCTKSDGTTPFVQVKPDKMPEVLGRAKYITPKESGCRLYIPPTFNRDFLQNAKVSLFLTEGAKKALKATQEGLPCLAFAGVDAWRDRRDGQSAAIPDLDQVVWKKRTVYIVYDSDLAYKMPVRWAEFRLCRELQQRGARVCTIRLPMAPNGKKQGFDDYLPTHSAENFCSIEPEEIEHPDKPGSVVRFTTLDLGDFLDVTLEHKPDIVGDGILTQASLVSLVGRAKLGKTWILTQLGLTVAGMDDHWLVSDIPVKTTGKVMYINAEVSEEIFQRRLRLMLQAAEKEGQEIGKARRQFFPVSVRGQLKLDKRDGEETLLKLADKIKPILIILDPIGPLHNLDENRADEMGRLLNTLQTVCHKTNASVLFSHHSAKNVEGREDIHMGRGSSVFGDRADTLLTLVPTGDQTACSRLRMSFILRNGPPRDNLILVKQPDECLYHASSQVDDAVKWMLAEMQEREQMDRTELKDRFKEAGYAGEYQFRQTLQRLLKGGYIESDKVGYPAKTTFRYRIQE